MEYIVSKFCFFSDVIDGYVLIYNSSKDTYIVITEHESQCINKDLFELPRNCPNLFANLVESGVLVTPVEDRFDYQFYNRKLEVMRMSMKTMCAVVIILDAPEDNNWIMGNSLFVQCINAIKEYCCEIGISKVRFILSHTDLGLQMHKYIEMIKSIMQNVKYDVEITENSKKHIYSREEPSLKVMGKSNYKKIEAPMVSNSMSDTEIYSYQKYLSAKSMYQYHEAMKHKNLFSEGVTPFSVLCPCLLENYYIIEYGILIKKCLSKEAGQANIVGIVDNDRLIFNHNKYNYILSQERLSEKCKSCVFVYVCMGQNCKICNNRKVITCMPIRKMLTDRLNQELSEYLREGDL